MMLQDRLYYLLEQATAQRMTTEECAEMEELTALDHPQAEEITLLMHTYFERRDVSVPVDTRQPGWQAILRAVLSVDIATPIEQPALRVSFLRRWWWAAAILIICATGAYLFTTSKKSEPILVEEKKLPAVNIEPGGNKALLTLSDGTTITLDSAANGALAQQGNSSVIKLGNGEIRYNLKGNSDGKVMMSTMSTPNGGQYKLILPDGSKVWLNAASSITYPVVFVGNDRKVKITGEVYMEVTQDKVKPFIVDIDGKSVVQVLGTSFNINAYADDGEIKTTLIEGSVKINHQMILKPGQQAVSVDANKPLRVVNANISQTLAWKNGLFDFNGLTVREVMSQLSRWYDINVQFKGEEPGFRFMGEMYRSANLSEVLKMLEKMEVKFKMEGKTLIVQ